MVSVAFPLIFGLVTVVLCTAHFLVGIWLGGRFRSQGTPGGAAINHHYNVQLAEVARLSDQLRRFAALCTNQFPALPATITAAAEELARAAALLNTRMQSKQAVSAPNATAPEASVEKAGFDLGCNELNSLTTLGRSAGERSGEPATATRYRYDTVQFVAPSDKGLPQPSAFRPVRTLDLSSGGLSYFAQEQKAQRSVVVSLGNPPDLCFLMATVEHSRPVHMYGVPGFVVGCRFVSRLEDVFTWDESADGIALRLDSARRPAGLELTCGRR